jgi:hypothetical protein
MKLTISIATAAVLLALGGCGTDYSARHGLAGPTADESKQAPGDHTHNAGDTTRFGTEPEKRGNASSGSTSGPTADESKQAPGDYSQSTGTIERIQ